MKAAGKAVNEVLTSAPAFMIGILANVYHVTPYLTGIFLKQVTAILLVPLIAGAKTTGAWGILEKYAR